MGAGVLVVGGRPAPAAQLGEVPDAGAGARAGGRRQVAPCSRLLQGYRQLEGRFGHRVGDAVGHVNLGGEEKRNRVNIKLGCPFPYTHMHKHAYMHTHTCTQACASRCSGPQGGGVRSRGAAEKQTDRQADRQRDRQTGKMLVQANPTPARC